MKVIRCTSDVGKEYGSRLAVGANGLPYPEVTQAMLQILSACIERDGGDPARTVWWVEDRLP